MSGLCVKCEQCEADLRDKMRRKGVAQADADYVIDYLTTHNFLSEERFVEAYVADKHKFNGWGRIKIRMMLASKRIDRNLVNEALEALDEKEYMEILTRILRTKVRGLDLSDSLTRQKLIRSMYGRGFEPALTSLAIRKLREE